MRTINMYINGQWIESASGKVTEIINPANGSTFAQATRGTAEDVSKAVTAAKEAFKLGSPWRNLTADEREELLNKAADLIEAKAEELAVAEPIAWKGSIRKPGTTMSMPRVAPSAITLRSYTNCKARLPRKMAIC